MMPVVTAKKKTSWPLWPPQWAKKQVMQAMQAMQVMQVMATSTKCSKQKCSKPCQIQAMMQEAQEMLWAEEEAQQQAS